MNGVNCFGFGTVLPVGASRHTAKVELRFAKEANQSVSNSRQGFAADALPGLMKGLP